MTFAQAQDSLTTGSLGAFDDGHEVTPRTTSNNTIQHRFVAKDFLERTSTIPAGFFSSTMLGHLRGSIALRSDPQL